MVMLPFCDLCYMDGEERRAVARYWDADNHEWVVCRKHLKHVKQAGLKYEPLEKPPPAGE